MYRVFWQKYWNIAVVARIKTYQRKVKGEANEVLRRT